MIENNSELFNALPFPCLLLEPCNDHFLINEVNTRYLQLSGKEKNELKGEKYPQPFPGSRETEKNLKQRMASLKIASTTGKPNKVNCLRYDLLCTERKAFQERYWQVENIPLIGQDGTVKQVLNIARDKTAEILEEKEKTKIQGELNNSIEKQKQIIDKNPDGIYSLDKEGNFLNLNDGLAKIAEISKEKMVNMHFLPFCSDEHRDYILSNFYKAVQGEMCQFEANFVSNEGNLRILNISLSPMKLGTEIAGVYGIAKDITNIRKTEEALKKSQNKFNSLVKESSDLLGILDIEGNYKFISETSVSILGISPLEFLGKNTFDFIHPEDRGRVIQEFSLLEEQKQLQINPFRFKNGQNTWTWIETTATNLIDDPEIEGIVTNSRDISEIIERTEEVRELLSESRALVKQVKKQNKLLKEVAWEQAHIVKAPLARLKGLLGVLKTESFGDWSRDEIFDAIEKSADELDEIIENIIRKTETTEATATNNKR